VLTDKPIGILYHEVEIPYLKVPFDSLQIQMQIGAVVGEQFVVQEYTRA
jgi:hypothetical protein